MSLWRHLTRGLRVLTNRTAADRDLDDEVQHYIEQATDAQVARGLSPADACRMARLEFGHTTTIKETVRDYGWERTVDSLIADARFAARMLRKSPVFSVVVVLVISLGSGAVTTVFSAMNAAVLRPLPGVADPDSLVSLRPARANGTVADQTSYARYIQLRDRSQTFDGLAAWGRVALTVSTDGGGTAILANMVTANYFDVLGVRPALGRFFAREENRTPGSHPVIVVSHRFWLSRLGADAAAVGRPVMVNGSPFTVIGVAPAGFDGIYTGLRTDAWVPVMMQPLLRPRSNLTSGSWLWLFGRLRNGAAIDGVERELAAVMAAVRKESGEPERPDAISSMRLSPLDGLPNGEGGPILQFMSLMLAAAGLVLLIACVNVVSMLSARYLARRREMALRSALGAGRTRLLRQLLTEVLALFMLGTLGGFIVAHLATAGLERFPLPDNVPLTLEFSPDLRVLVFALGTTLAAGLVFGLPVALRGARRDCTAGLRDDSPGAGRRRSFMSRSLIVGQLALSLVLLVVAGLFVRALDRGQHIDTGFDPARVMTATLEPESWGYSPARARAFYGALREHLQSVPGIVNVSYTGRMPLMMGSSIDDVTVDGGTQQSIHYAAVDIEYFSLLKIPVLQGRAFSATDGDRAPRVAVVNATLARRLWPDGGAIGSTFRFRGESTTVVGIVADAKYAALDEAVTAFAYFPLAQIWQPTQVLLVRTGTAPEAYARALQQAAVAIDPLLPPPRVTTMQRAIGFALLPQRTAAIVTGVLGALALLLAAVGLYGIMAFSVSRRTREIGIRSALGAGRQQILGMVMREAIHVAAAGVLVGLGVAALATRLIAGWLFDVSPLDLVTFAGMSALFTAVALLASYLPARRAASANPLVALRAE